MSSSENLGASIARSIAQAGAEIDAEIRRERPRREALAAFDRSTARLVERRDTPGGHPSYAMLRLAAVSFVPAHVATYQYLGDSRKRTRQEPDAIAWPSRRVPVDRLVEFVRRPSAKALARIEAAEAAIAAARAELVAAQRAAFTFGKPVNLTTIKRTTRERRELDRSFDAKREESHR